MAENLMDGLLSEMNRVREIIIEYRAIPGGAGNLAAALMAADIQRAERAIGSGSDVIEMLQAYEALKSYEL